MDMMITRHQGRARREENMIAVLVIDLHGPD